MVRKTYTPEQIINKLREVEVLISQGATTMEASRKIGITDQTYYRRCRGQEDERRARELPNDKAVVGALFGVECGKQHYLVKIIIEGVT